VLGLTALADDGILAELMLGKRKLDEATAEDPQLGLSLLIGALGSTPLMMAYWFAPLLAGWGRISAARRCSSASSPAGATGGPSWPTRSG
jgi:hypothetical protein